MQGRHGEGRRVARTLSTRSVRALSAGLAVTLAACSSHEDGPAPGCASAVSSSGVQVNNGIGALNGTLALPAGCGSFPAVLILPGSGSIDRDGNEFSAGVYTNTYAQISEALAAQGIASVRYDKAGVGASAMAVGAITNLRVEREAADAALWVDLLRADSRFDAIVLAGHSEGALLALLVAESKSIDAYASLEGAGRPIDEVLREQLARNSGLSAELLAQANALFDELLLGRSVTDVPPELEFLFPPRIQPYLMSWMRYDPAQEFAKTTMPALIVQGTADVQTSLIDAERLEKARPDARKLVVEAMHHMLKPATLEHDSQARAYSDRTLPVKAEVVEALRDLVREIVPTP